MNDNPASVSPKPTITNFLNPDYKVGSKTVDGLTITKIYGSSTHFVVYATKEAGTGFTTSDEVDKGAAEALERILEVQSCILTQCPVYAQEGLIDRAAGALSSCFRQAANGQKVSTLELDRIIKAVGMVRSAAAKRTYVFYSLITWLALSAAGFVVLWIAAVFKPQWGYFPMLLRGAVCGSAGALFSVLINCAKARLSDDLTTPGIINYQGAIRIIAGSFGGALAMAAIDSNQIFPWAKDSSSAYVFICAGSGFVERLIPDLFDRGGAKDNTKDKDEATA